MFVSSYDIAGVGAGVERVVQKGKRLVPAEVERHSTAELGPSVSHRRCTNKVLNQNEKSKNVNLQRLRLI